MTTVTPAYHAEQYGPDDNRFDERPLWVGIAYFHQTLNVLDSFYPYLSSPYKKIEEALKSYESKDPKRGKDEWGQV